MTRQVVSLGTGWYNSRSRTTCQLNLIRGLEDFCSDHRPFITLYYFYLWRSLWLTDCREKLKGRWPQQSYYVYPSSIFSQSLYNPHIETKLISNPSTDWQPNRQASLGSSVHSVPFARSPASLAYRKLCANTMSPISYFLICSPLYWKWIVYNTNICHRLVVVGGSICRKTNHDDIPWMMMNMSKRVCLLTQPADRNGWHKMMAKKMTNFVHSSHPRRPQHSSLLCTSR